MKKTILLTGATDGIGYEVSKEFAKLGHDLIIVGRDNNKLNNVADELRHINSNGNTDIVCCDLSNLTQVIKMTEVILDSYQSIDIIINNAGVFKTSNTQTIDNLDIRFTVNTISPYIITRELLPLLSDEGRVINLSSAAQAPINISALKTYHTLDDGDAYAQSKLAIIMWTNVFAKDFKDSKKVFCSLNPASFLGTKMVHEAYGMSGKDISIGSDIIKNVALSSRFKTANGKYFDNDINQFSNPYPDALDDVKCKEIVKAIESLICNL